jgi:hypothetical protein
MSDPIVQIPASVAKRLVGATRRTERVGFRDGSNAERAGGMVRETRVRALKIRSTTTTDGYYPVDVMYKNVSTGNYVDTGIDAWLDLETGWAAAVDRIYYGTVAGVRTADGLAVFDALTATSAAPVFIPDPFPPTIEAMATGPQALSYTGSTKIDGRFVVEGGAYIFNYQTDVEERGIYVAQSGSFLRANGVPPGWPENFEEDGCIYRVLWGEVFGLTHWMLHQTGDVLEILSDNNIGTRAVWEFVPIIHRPDIHPPVRAVVTTNTNRSLLIAGGTYGGVNTVPNDRVLLAGQTNKAENGLYVLRNGQAAERVWDGKVFKHLAGTVVTVLEGTGRDQVWMCISNGGNYRTETSWNNMALDPIIDVDPNEWRRIDCPSDFTTVTVMTNMCPTDASPDHIHQNEYLQLNIPTEWIGAAYCLTDPTDCDCLPPGSGSGSGSGGSGEGGIESACCGTGNPVPNVLQAINTAGCEACVPAVPLTYQVGGAHGTGWYLQWQGDAVVLDVQWDALAAGTVVRCSQGWFAQCTRHKL